MARERARREPPGAYRVELTNQADKDLVGLRAHATRVSRALLALEDDPRKGHTLTGSLRGVRSLEFSLPGGAHRAAYYVLVDDRVCLVFAVGPHENFYKLAQRRYQALIKAGRVPVL